MTEKISIYCMCLQEERRAFVIQEKILSSCSSTEALLPQIETSRFCMQKYTSTIDVNLCE